MIRSHATTYLYKRKNGRYYVGQRVDGRVVWRSTGETARSAALHHLKALSDEIRRIRSDDSLCDFAARFLSISAQNMAPKTLDIYRRTLRLFARVSGDLPLYKLTGEHWDRFKSERIKTVAPASVNLELRALRACLNTAVNWGLLSSNPFLKKKLVSVQERLPSYFTAGDIARLKAVVEDPLYWDIILFAVLSGCRRGEILALRWMDYDQGRGTVTITCSAGFRTKTGRHRVLPVHSALRDMLERRAMDRQGEFIFSDGQGPLKGNNVTKRVREYIRRAGLRRELHFHSLRHSFASFLIQSGESLYMVQRLLGHTSPRMTQVYSHLEPTNLHRSVERIEIGAISIDPTTDNP